MTEPTTLSWHSVGQCQRNLAELDSRDIRPMLLGYVGEMRLVLVELRPFEQGHYQEPIIEALTVPLALDCDRISLAMPARAWSLEDPVLPATKGVDLRQRVLAETRVVDDAGTIATTSVLHPFDIDGSIRWHDEVVMPPAQGWITHTLSEAMGMRTDLHDEFGPLEAMARADHLGHLVAIADHAQHLFMARVTRP